MESNHLHGRVLNRDKGTIDQMRKTRTIPFVISTGLKDRHGTILNQKNWDLSGYERNPIVGYQHQVHPEMCVKGTPDDVIGKGMNLRFEGENPVMDVWFEPKELNETADKVFEKLLAGTLNAVSVGFLPITNEKGEESYMGRAENGEDPTAEYFYGQELLEVSVVNIPSNKEALQKSYRESTTRALLFIRQATGKSIAEIEKLTVREVVDMIEGRKQEIEDTPVETPEVEETESQDEETTDAAKAVSDEHERLTLELELNKRKLQTNGI